MSTPLIDELVRRGRLDAEQAQRLPGLVAERGGTLDTALLELGWCDETTISSAMGAAYGLGVASPSTVRSPPDAAAVRAFPEQWARKHMLAPLALDHERGELSVLAIPPPDAAVLEKLGAMLELRVTPLLTTELRVHERLSLLYGAPVPERFVPLLAAGSRRPSLVAGSIAPASRMSDAPLDNSLRDVLGRLREASTRDQIIDLALDRAQRDFDFTAFFVVTDQHVNGRSARGVGSESIAKVALPATGRSAFATAVRTQAHVLGPLSGEDHRSMAVIGRPAPRAALIVPVRVRDRTVGLVYADQGDHAISPRAASELMLIVNAMGSALEGLVMRKKSGIGPASPVRASSLPTPVSTLPRSSLPSAPASRASLTPVVVPFRAPEAARAERAAPVEVRDEGGASNGAPASGGVVEAPRAMDGGSAAEARAAEAAAIERVLARDPPAEARAPEITPDAVLEPAPDVAASSAPEIEPAVADGAAQASPEASPDDAGASSATAPGEDGPSSRTEPEIAETAAPIADAPAVEAVAHAAPDASDAPAPVAEPATTAIVEADAPSDEAPPASAGLPAFPPFAAVVDAAPPAAESLGDRPEAPAAPAGDAALETAAAETAPAAAEATPPSEAATAAAKPPSEPAPAAAAAPRPASEADPAPALASEPAPPDPAPSFGPRPAPPARTPSQAADPSRAGRPEGTPFRPSAPWSPPPQITPPERPAYRASFHAPVQPPPEPADAPDPEIARVPGRGSLLPTADIGPERYAAPRPSMPSDAEDSAWARAVSLSPNAAPERPTSVPAPPRGSLRPLEAPVLPLEPPSLGLPSELDTFRDQDQDQLAGPLRHDSTSGVYSAAGSEDLALDRERSAAAAWSAPVPPWASSGTPPAGSPDEDTDKIRKRAPSAIGLAATSALPVPPLASELPGPADQSSDLDPQRRALPRSGTRRSSGTPAPADDRQAWESHVSAVWTAWSQPPPPGPAVPSLGNLSKHSMTPLPAEIVGDADSVPPPAGDPVELRRETWVRASAARGQTRPLESALITPLPGKPIARSDDPVRELQGHIPVARGEPLPTEHSHVVTVSGRVEKKKAPEVERTAVVARPAARELDYGPIIDKAEAGDAQARVRLLDHAEAALPAIMRRFPGRLTIDPFASSPLPAFAQCGPLLELISAIGPPAHAWIAERLDDPLPVVRLLAVHFYGANRLPDVLPRLTRRLHDEEPRVAQLAVTVLASYREDRGYQNVLAHLHARLGSPSPNARRHAARLLGMLVDTTAVPALAATFDRKDKVVYDAVEAALAEITRQRFGASSKKWMAWWESHKKQHRVEWLIDALEGSDPELRGAAADELRELSGIDPGFVENGPKRTRDEARRRWQEWWAARSRGRPSA